MIQQFIIAAILGSGIVFVIFWFIDCLVLDSECKHEKQAIYDSYHKTVCIDCGQEFSTKEIKK